MLSSPPPPQLLQSVLGLNISNSAQSVTRAMWYSVNAQHQFGWLMMGIPPRVFVRSTPACNVWMMVGMATLFGFSLGLTAHTCTGFPSALMLISHPAIRRNGVSGWYGISSTGVNLL